MPARAQAEPPKATLDYARQERATTECPDESTFRALVAAKLGYDPFGAGAGAALRVVFRRSGSDLSGILTLESGGAPRGERTLRSAGAGCDELAASLALAAAVALDPNAVANRDQDAAPVPVPVPTPSPTPASPPAPSPPRPPEPSRRPLRLRVFAGAFVPLGLTPSVTAGARLAAGLDGESWLLGLEGGATLESSKGSTTGKVTAQRIEGALVPCLRPELSRTVALALCAIGRLGVVRSSAEQVTRASPKTDLVSSVGPRAGVELFPWPSVGFSAEIEAPVSLTRVHLLIDDQGVRREVWASSRVGMMAALGMIFRL